MARALTSSCPSLRRQRVNGELGIIWQTRVAVTVANNCTIEARTKFTASAKHKPRDQASNSSSDIPVTFSVHHYSRSAPLNMQLVDGIKYSTIFRFTAADQELYRYSSTTVILFSLRLDLQLDSTRFSASRFFSPSTDDASPF